MAKTIALSTIGVKIGYAVSETRPTQWKKSTISSLGDAGFTRIEGFKSTPDFNAAPNSVDVTTFENQISTSKLGLLKEAADNYEFKAVLSQGFADDWKTAVSTYASKVKGTDNVDGKKRMWWVIEVPGYSDAQYFSGEPMALSLSGLEVNNSIEITVYVVPDGAEAEVAVKPTLES